MLPIALLALLPTALAATYQLSDNYVGEGFLSSWTHENIADPTSGRVTYVDQATALSKNLTYTSSDTLVMRCDSTTTLAASDPGRDSVRIKSTKSYSTHAVVFDIRHMPEGCATWPAAWETLEDGWPASGEVDIVEGVNGVEPNQMTLHTTAGCTMPATRDETGTPITNDCNYQVSGNPGCAVHDANKNSYGADFNTNGGGWYAMERTPDFVKVWFWPRNSGSVPAGVSSPSSTSVITDNWGTPSAYFSNTSCDISSHFGENNIIINLTLCGAWAGQTNLFNGAGCSGDCITFVNENPSAFVNAYWDIANIRVYE